MRKLVWILAFAACVAAVPAECRAAETQLFLGAIGFTGEHKEAGALIRNDATIALPVFAFRHRSGPIEVDLEEVPPIGPVRFPEVSNGLHEIRAGYSDGTVRYWMPKGRFSIGIGESLYVQRSTYLWAGQYKDERAIRAAGARYEITGAIPISAQRSISVGVALSPAMHQRFSEWFPSAGAREQNGTASLMDASFTVQDRHGAGHVLAYGLRYVNYAGGTYRGLYDATAQRTRIEAAFVAWGLSLGH